MGMLGVRLGFLLWLRGRDQPPPDDGHRARRPKKARPSSATSEKALTAAEYKLGKPFGITL